MRLPAGITARSCTVSWAALLGLTTISFLLGSHVPGRVLMLSVLGLTLIKAQLVVSNFMGLRAVRPMWQIVTSAYLLVVGSVIALACLPA